MKSIFIAPLAASVILFGANSAVADQPFDVSKTCRQMGEAIVAAEFGYIPAQLLHAGKAEDILEAFKKSRSSATSAWMLMMSPHSEARYAALLLQAYRMQMTFGFSVDEIVAAAKSQSRAYTAEELALIRTSIANIAKDPYYDQDIAFIKSSLPALCAPYGSVGCVASGRFQADLMHPRFGRAGFVFSIMPTLEQVLTDARYVRGAALATVLALELVERSRKGEKIKAEVLPLLVKAFQGDRTRNGDALESAWSLLALYGAFGSSVEGRAFSFMPAFKIEQVRALWASMHVLFASIEYLNSVSAPANSFGYHSSIKTDCDYGKAYRFWMAAYLAREATKKGHSPRSSALSSYLLGLLYEMGSSNYKRNPLSLYFQPHLSLASHGARINMAFTAAGAEFGAHSNRPHLIKLDAAVVAEVKGAKPHGLEQKELEEALKSPTKRYSIWKKIVAPDEAYRLISGF